MNDPKTVPCELCGTPTPMTGTKRCDRCWELERRVYMDPELSVKVLKGCDGICNICGVVLTDNPDSLNYNCGGDCLLCMSQSGDTDCIKMVEKIIGKLYD